MEPVRKTPEQKRARSTEMHKQWRKDNPEKQKAIMERFWAKKAEQMKGK